MLSYNELYSIYAVEITWTETWIYSC